MRLECIWLAKARPKLALIGGRRRAGGQFWPLEVSPSLNQQSMLHQRPTHRSHAARGPACDRGGGAPREREQGSRRRQGRPREEPALVRRRLVHPAAKTRFTAQRKPAACALALRGCSSGQGWWRLGPGRADDCRERLRCPALCSSGYVMDHCIKALPSLCLALLCLARLKSMDGALYINPDSS